MKYFVSLLVLSLVSSIGSAQAPSFRHDVMPTLTRLGCNSGACHGALAGKGGLKLSLRGYDLEADHYALTRQAQARRVDTSAPTESLLLKKGTRTIPHGGGKKFDLDSDHFRLLQGWIAAGAPGPAATDARVVRLELAPQSVTAKPTEKHNLRVTAQYSDGSKRDVTHWAKFVTSEEPVASVDEDGQIRVSGFGEAGISALFGTEVATMRVTVPFPNRVSKEVFTGSRRVNLIDDHVLAKLQQLNLTPAGPCSDAEFLRRVYLDTCGLLPTPAELEAFLADRSPKKREQVIDQLLDRTEFVDYWAHKWSDLLLVSSRKLPAPAMWAFYRSVRRSVADNQPWDQFARELLTATGSTLTQGTGNYYVLHKDVTDLVESTAVTFLGLSVQCCRCHNHPLEKWTQDQYWAQANLFSRVGLKDGTRAGEVIVHPLAAGDAFHPRRGEPMPPTPLDGSSLPLGATSDRRAHFADWLTRPENPYFARAIVNRVWRNYLGRGLVEAEDDLRATNPPSNPDLFDAVVLDFITHKYDLKHLMRLILNSATYQRSAVPPPGTATDDRFYSRYLVRRLSAEVILDAYSDITGVPTAFNVQSLGPSGGTAGANYPPGTRAMQLPDSLLVSRFLDSFGRAGREQTCSCERTAEPSVGQALHLNNGQTLNDKLRDPKSTLSRWLAEQVPNEVLLNRIFRHALSRSPTEAERDRILAVIRDSAKTSPEARREALEDVFWAILTGKEFLFNR